MKKKLNTVMYDAYFDLSVDCAWCLSTSNAALIVEPVSVLISPYDIYCNLQTLCANEILCK